MAVVNLLTLLDDIATILDDVAIYSKLAAKKTAPVIGDDLAVNAEQVSGVKANRELPVIWAVAKGSFINKCILVPVALLISFFYPPLIQWLLMLGGAFLCFEGAEKLLHSFSHVKDHAIKATVSEKQKIRGAIRTDFILSAEIIVIALGAMGELDSSTLMITLSVFALSITVLVYGLVAGIVKLDDAGFALMQSSSAMLQTLGKGILWFAPNFMKTLSMLGMFAMFLVGGGILIHGVAVLHHLQVGIGEAVAVLNIKLAAMIAEQVFILVIGLVVGVILARIYMLFSSEIEVQSRTTYSPHANYRNQNLSGKDFGPLKKNTRSEMFGSDFTGANLSNCNFQEADLRDCDFTDANLSGANFTNAGMTGAIFKNTNVTGAIFKDTRLFNILDDETDFSTAILATKYQGDKRKMADKDTDRDGIELLEQ